jgi:hypothetical protein
VQAWNNKTPSVCLTRTLLMFTDRNYNTYRSETRRWYKIKAFKFSRPSVSIWHHWRILVWDTDDGWYVNIETLLLSIHVTYCCQCVITSGWLTCNSFCNQITLFLLRGRQCSTSLSLHTTCRNVFITTYRGGPSVSTGLRATCKLSETPEMYRLESTGLLRRVHTNVPDEGTAPVIRTGVRFLRNVRNHVQDYRASWPRRAVPIY